MEKRQRNRIIRNIILIIIFIATLAFAVYRFLPNYRIYGGSALKSIPEDASIIVKTNNFKNMVVALKKNLFWDELSNLEATVQLNRSMQYLDSIADINNNIESIFKNKTYISFHLIGIDKIKPVYYFTLSNTGNNQIKHHIKNLLKGKGTITSRKYENYTIFDANVTHKKINFSYIISNGLFIISPSSLLIENVVRQINSGISVTKQTGFREVQKTAGNSSVANVYINYKTIDNILYVALNKKYTHKLKMSDQFADWSEFDITIKNQLLHLNGFSFTSDSLNNILNILSGQTPQKFTLHNVFPAVSNSFYSLSLSDPALFKQKYHKYLDRNGILVKYTSKIESYKNYYSTNFEHLIYDILENEIGILHSHINNTNNTPETFLVIKTKGKNIAVELLNEMLQNWGKIENKNVRDFKKTYKIDEGSSCNIYEFPVPTLFNDLFGVFFNYNSAKYFTVVDNYLIFSGDDNALSKLFYANVLNKTLNNTLEYNDFNEYVNGKSNLYYYIKLAKSNEIIDRYLDINLQKIYIANHETFEKINTIAFQISGADNMLYNNITINYVNKTYDNPITEWETLLDTSISFKPVFVKNHYTHENEIFVQDLKNNIYLINNSGRIIWKQKLNEAINSEIYQVDYYKNGKLQLLFNTATEIHLIDRNGNYVERYPIKLRSNATAGLALFDYDNNKTYRLFIPCINNQIYAYNIEGKIVTGWEFQTTDHQVINPVQHFRVDSKDYIVFADKNKVYITDRKGNTRVHLKKQFSKSKNNIFYLDNYGNKPKLVTTDILGKVKLIDFDGSITTIDIKNFSENHYFSFNDINADGRNDLIFVDMNELFVYNINKNDIYEISFKENINDPPVYFNFSSRDKKIGIINTEKKEIYLINNSGKIYKGFPLTGSSLFSIGILKNNYGNFNLIVGGRNNYLYNYAIN